MSSLLSPEEHLSLLSLPKLEAIFFRSVCLHRPVGPVRHWAVLSIARDLNSTIESLGERKRKNGNRTDGGEGVTTGTLGRERGKKRKRERGDTNSKGGGRGREKKLKTEDGEQEDAEGRKEGEELQEEEDDAESGGNDEVDPEASDADEEEGTGDEEEEEELSEEEEAVEEVHKMKSRGTLHVTPEVVWTKLDVFFNTEGLDDLEYAALSPSELACAESVRLFGFGSSIRDRPSGIKVRETNQEEEEEDEEEEQDEDDESLPIDFALVPGLEFEGHLAARRIQPGEEVLARAAAGLAGPTSPARDRKGGASQRVIKEEAGDSSSELSEGDLGAEERTEDDDEAMLNEDGVEGADQDSQAGQTKTRRTRDEASASFDQGDEEAEEGDEEDDEEVEEENDDDGEEEEEGEEDEEGEEEEGEEGEDESNDGITATPTRGRARPIKKAPAKVSGRSNPRPSSATTATTATPTTATPKTPRVRTSVASATPSRATPASASRSTKATRSNAASATPARRSSMRKR